MPSLTLLGHQAHVQQDQQADEPSNEGQAHLETVFKPSNQAHRPSPIRAGKTTG